MTRTTGSEAHQEAEQDGKGPVRIGTIARRLVVFGPRKRHLIDLHRVFGGGREPEGELSRIQVSRFVSAFRTSNPSLTRP